MEDTIPVTLHNRSNNLLSHTSLKLLIFLTVGSQKYQEVQTGVSVVLNLFYLWLPVPRNLIQHELQHYILYLIIAAGKY